MSLLTQLRAYYGLAPRDAMYETWPQIQSYAEFIPEWEFRRNVQVAYLALMWAGKNTRLREVLSPYARVPKPKTHNAGIVRDLRVAIHLGIVSQKILDSFDTNLADEALGI